MSKTLLERAYTIRDEVSEAANSAYRVGQLLVDMLLQLQRAGGDYLSSVRDSVAMVISLLRRVRRFVVVCRWKMVLL